jgi:hypothetical protein
MLPRRFHRLMYLNLSLSNREYRVDQTNIIDIVTLVEANPIIEWIESIDLGHRGRRHSERGASLQRAGRPRVHGELLR